MRKWLPLVTVCLGTFMLLIDVTIVNVALPDMAKDLKTSFGSLQWVVDAYALTLAALVLGTGSIADLVGHRRAYVAGLALFAVSSFACGIAPGSGTLVAARAVQGVGGAAMFATTFALLNSNYTGRDRGTAYGMWGAVAGASAAVGPIIGGLLTQGVSWRWIFFVNLPVSVLAIVLCVVVLETRTPRRAGGSTSPAW
jgi:MFS family permease